MTLAKPTSTNATDFSVATSEVVDQHRLALESRLGNLATQATNGVLGVWAEYRPVATDKTQAFWRLLRSTQPVQLLLSAALAVLAIALVTLVTTFNGLIILFLKMAALVLAAVAIWQWVARGFHWADQQLPSVTEPKE